MFDVTRKTAAYIVRGKAMQPCFINGTVACRIRNGIGKLLVYYFDAEGNARIDLMSIKSVREKEFKLEACKS